MKLSQQLFAAGLTLVFVSGCGKDSKKATASTLGISVPTINFELPSAGSTNLTTADTPLADMQTRVNGRIDKLNEDLAKFTTRFTEYGTFTGKGSDGSKSGSFTALTDDATYAYKLVLCESGHVNIITKWSADGKKVYSIRDHQYQPSGTEDSRVEMTYTETTTEKTFVQKFYGHKANAAAATDYTADYFSATQTVGTTSTFNIKSVEDNFTGPATSYTATPDRYIVGTLTSANEADATVASGKFVGCGNLTTPCAWSDETNVSDSSWTKQSSLTGTTSTNGTNLWTTGGLSAIGFASKTNLGDLTLSTETCP